MALKELLIGMNRNAARYATVATKPKFWAEWRDEVLTELESAHPQIRTLTTRLDVRLIGHAMARPTPGLVWGAARAKAAASRPLGRVHFAHSDLSALPLFEEAVYWGTRVASEVASKRECLSVPCGSSQ